MNKRLNVKFVVRLVVSTLVVGVAIGVLHMFQVQREAGALRNLAKSARDKGELDKARQFYSRYLGYVRDDNDAFGELSLILCDLAEEPDASNRDRLFAMERMEKALQLDPSNTKVRRRLANFESRLGRFSDAKEHAEILLKDSPDDAELHLILGRCYAAMDDIQKATNALRKSIDSDKSQIEAFQMLLALAMREVGGPSEEAEKLLDEMIAANPDSSEAHLLRARYFAGAKKEKEASEAVKIALEQSPDDTDVLLQAASHALRTEQFDKAREHLLRGVELYPEEVRFYQMLSLVERIDRQLPAAIAYLKQGIEALPDNPQLLSALAEVQLESRDVEAAESTIEKLGSLKVVPDMLDLLTARVRAGANDWEETRRILERLRTRVVRNQQMSKGVNMLLGEAYMRLGQPELQVEALQRVLSLNPNAMESKTTLILLSNGFQALGRREEARNALAKAAQGGDLSVMLNLISMDMSRVLALPKERRNWVLMERMLEQFEGMLTEETPPDARAQLSAWQAEVLFQKDEQDAAIELLATRRAEHPDLAAYWLAEAQLQARRENYEQALVLLDEAESQLPESRLRIALVRVVVYQSVGDDDSREKLEAMAKGGEGLTEDEHLMLLRRVALVFRGLRDTDRAVELNRHILGIKNGDAVAHLALFEMAVLSEDEPATKKTLDELEAALGRDSFAWHFANALQAVNAARGDAGNKDDLLAQAQQHVADANKIRAGVPQLIGLRAEIEDLLGNTDDAIEGYLRAIERGASRIGHFRRLVALLTERGRNDEIDRLIRRMPALFKKTGLERFATTWIIQNRGSEDAEKFVRQSYDESSTDFRAHVLFANVMARRGKLDEAERAFRRAVEAGGDQAAPWISLVDFLTRIRKIDDAREAMERAEEALPEETAMLTRARCHEILGDRREAERFFLQALEARQEDLIVLANVADYFNRSDRPEQAKKHMRRVLEIGSQDPQQNQALMAAARRGIAELTTRGGTYQDHLAAMELIRQNRRPDGSLGAEDTWIKGQILARRQDGNSRREAIRIIEDLLAMRPSNARARLILAQLYVGYGENTKARDHMTQLCLDFPRNAQYKAELINVLLANNAVGEAAGWLQTLAQENPGAAETMDATARVRVKQGRIDEAISTITSLVPARPVSPDKLPLLRQVAAALNELAPLAESDEHRDQIIDAGLQLLHRYVDAEPKGILALADYLARNRQLDDALDQCQKAIAAGFSVVQVVDVGLRAIRNELPKAEPKHFEVVEGWIEPAVTKRPDSADLLVQMAELQDMKGDYDASEQYYRRVLPLTDVNYLRRAQVLNNLSFLLALRSKDYDEALKMVEEAIEVVGPISDILDTRAVVLIARGAVDSAISDLRQAVDDNPSGMKYFHLAHAYLLAKNRKAAADALNKAHQEGLTSDEVPPLERSNYRMLLDEVGQRSAERPVRLRGVNRSLRAAG